MHNRASYYLITHPSSAQKHQTRFVSLHVQQLPDFFTQHTGLYNLFHFINGAIDTQKVIGQCDFSEILVQVVRRKLGKNIAILDLYWQTTFAVQDNRVKQS